MAGGDDSGDDAPTAPEPADGDGRVDEGARYLLVFLDICATGLWQNDGHVALPEDLPISPKLVARIERWQDEYDAWEQTHNDGGDPPECHPDFPFAYFDDEGKAIAADLRAELPDWTINCDACWRPKPRIR